MLRKIKEILLQPFPFESSLKNKIITILSIGTFVEFFILTFGLLDKEGISNPFIILGFGLIVMSALFVNMIIVPYILPAYFSDAKWNIWKEFIYKVWGLVLISFLLLAYADMGNYYKINFENFLMSFWVTFSIGIFPITFNTILKQNILIKKYSGGAVTLNEEINRRKEDSTRSIIIYSENNKDCCRFNESNLLYIKSADNYLEIFSIENGSIEKKLIRGTIKRVEEQLTDINCVFRCHRAYIVNLRMIQKVSGNSQGYKIHFASITEVIPVSRNLSKAFKNRLNSQNISAQ